MANSPRRSDSENAPPTPSQPKSKVRGGIQGSSRRRRARSTGSPHHPRYAVGHAKQKATKQQSWLVNPSSNDAASPYASPAVSMSAFSLPRYLSRPSFRQVTKATIASVAPELADTELGYIHQGLQCLGPRMLQVLAGVKAEPSSNVLPLKLDVVVNDLSSDMPTHMLGVYSRHVPAAAKRRVTLFPIHNIILATHCANLPILPPSNVTRPDAAGATISLPMVPLCIPAPDVFPQLSMFLYTKRIDHLLTSLLPCPVPHALYRDDPKSEAVLALLQRFSDGLATSHSAETLFTHAMRVNGLWRNVCALGINDTKLWCALDVAWEVLMNALAVSTGRRL
ncbi:hypothetical protein L210DRAFT_3468701 [Boletus edulis BED1]|uniref:Clp1-like protein n=1 Tax=Boletus edulis BED1 TaxID=1328754 RepID=A0AAD4CAB2_BOLED|nr:hypothetical protein L210DRAFT_3468701 [Boletus edulis BED1]